MNSGCSDVGRSGSGERAYWSECVTSEQVNSMQAGKKVIYHPDYPNLELRQHLRDLRDWVPKRQAEIRQSMAALQDETERLEAELLRVRAIVRGASGKQPYSDD